MSVLLLVVWPKLKRVLGGEKVVMSKLLDCRFSSSGTFQQGGASSNGTDHTNHVPTNAEQRKAISLGEPLPPDIEQHMIGTQNLLRDLSSKLYVRVVILFVSNSLHLRN